MKGDDICTESEDQNGIMVAELPDISAPPVVTEKDESQSTPVTSVDVNAHPDDIGAEPDKIMAVPATEKAPVTATKKPEKHIPTTDRTETADNQQTPSGTDVKRPGPGGTFLVIASYHRVGDAKRFASQQAKLETRVLSGTARGRQVYRVAIGPVTPSDRQPVKRKLLKSGYDDVWTLRQSNPKVIVEIASLE